MLREKTSLIQKLTLITLVAILGCLVVIIAQNGARKEETNSTAVAPEPEEPAPAAVVVEDPPPPQVQPAKPEPIIISPAPPTRTAAPLVSREVHSEPLPPVSVVNAGPTIVHVERQSPPPLRGNRNFEGDIHKQTIRIIGSDTMVNLAQAWAEAYASVDPNVSVEVAGGGSGIGIAALFESNCEIANSTRKLDPQELQKAKAKHGREPSEFTVAYDALAICVHPSNPLNEITLDQLGQIYREGGRIDNWSQLGVKLPKGRGWIVRASRQNNSGAYHFFREVVIGKKFDFKLGSRDMNGSKDVIELVARTPNAIGYSGLGYVTTQVKTLKIAAKQGGLAVAPTPDTVLDKTYPLGHALFMYTPGEPPMHVRRFIQWVLSPQGQDVVELTGYIALPRTQTASR